MIGIDITRISRFSLFSDKKLLKLGQKYNTNFSTYTDAAKWWACHEAVIKCLGTPPNWKNNKILFPQNKAPALVGEHNITLSLSHEGDLVVAVAILNSHS